MGFSTISIIKTLLKQQKKNMLMESIDYFFYTILLALFIKKISQIVANQRKHKLFSAKGHNLTVI